MGSRMSASDTWKGANRLTSQIEQKLRSAKILFRAFLIAFSCVFLLSVSLSHNPYDMKMSGVWLVAKYKAATQIQVDTTVRYRDRKGQIQTFPASRLAAQKQVIEGHESFVLTLVYCALFSLFCALVSTYFFRDFLVRFYARRKSKKELIRGAVLVEEDALITQLKNAKIDSDICVGNVPLRRGAEVQHIFINGASGTGKGNATKDILDTIRARKQRFVVYDKSGEYVAKYYREGHDILLNPFDERMPLWTPWNEIKTYYDCEHLAASFIPREKGEKQHWVDAPRTVFADLLYELRRQNCTSVQDLVDAVFDKKRLAELLVGTASQSVLDPDAPEQAGSVRSILAPKVRSLRYLPVAEEWFSFREWVRDEDSDRCVFIVTNERQLQSVKPLISAWIDIIISEVLSLPENRDRRLFVGVDELASLDQIGSIKTALFEGRKFGLCMILSVTSIEMLKELYGEKIARSMVSMCATKITFRSDEPESAEWLARLYGEEDITEEREGLTMSDRYDSTNIQDQRQRHQLLLPTEFINLPDMEAVIKLGGGLPVAKIRVHYVERETISEVLIEREQVEPLRAQPAIENREYEDFLEESEDVEEAETNREYLL